MNKKKSKNIFTKNNEYEKYFLFIISVIAIVFGILILLDIISIEEIMALPSDNVCAILFIVLGTISGIISLYTIIKENRFNKTPKPLIYEFVKNAYEKENKELKEVLNLNGYSFVLGEDIFLYDNEYSFSVKKENIVFDIYIDYKEIHIDLSLTEEMDENVKDEFYDYENELFSKQVLLNRNYNLNDLISLLDMLYSEKASLFLERYEQYKI